MTASNSEYLISSSQLELADARLKKSEKLKNVGEPLQLPGKALAIEVIGNNAWIAENTTVARSIDLVSGKTTKLYRGHRGPVSALALWHVGSRQILVTGSWDKTIKLWDADSKELISSTDAHSDFVKSLLVIPSVNLLVSGSSDKLIRFWHLSVEQQPLQSAGSLSSHTRPVECLADRVLPDGDVELCTGDTMGIIRLWTLTEADRRWTCSLKAEFNHHRTKISDLYLGSGQLWTASGDETVQVRNLSETEKKPTPPPIHHSTAVRCILPLYLTDLQEPYIITGSGDFLRVYDVSSADEPELLNEIDAHWHDITHIRLWMRQLRDEKNNQKMIEPWIITTSLDCTVRRWKLSELLVPKLEIIEPPAPATPPAKTDFAMTAEEEQELDELLNSD
ncbi:WD40-repeat-containing domain protein [Lentinula aciculospora]|uniref:WD40-repeat-containing domain protein n=1 Tax=Lentinula aciculospora TaxID=153920 RepID=A0A9W9AQS2_9AGAR|nr:WD40-repeat-containing domain protein [Lentinula aciculospora]